MYTLLHVHITETIVVTVKSMINHGVFACQQDKQM